MMDLAPVSSAAAPAPPQPESPQRSAFTPKPPPEPPQPQAAPPPRPIEPVPQPMAAPETSPLPEPAVVSPPPPPPHPPPVPPLEPALPPRPQPVLRRPVPQRPVVRQPLRPMRDSTPEQAPAAPTPNAALVPPAAAPAVPTVSAASSSAVPGWRSELIGRLQRSKHYPDTARERDEQGVAAVTFVMDRNGHVLSATLVRSSGSQALDDEAVALVRRAEPLPPMPAELAGNTIKLTLPVTFSLR